jgi:hypothetical protein
MDRMAAGILILLVTLSPPAAQDKGGEKADSPAEQYRALVKEFGEAAHANWNATTDEERKQIAARIEKLPLRLLELVEKYPKDPIALDALTQVVTQEYWLENFAGRPEQVGAVPAHSKDLPDRDGTARTGSGLQKFSHTAFIVRRQAVS